MNNLNHKRLIGTLLISAYFFYCIANPTFGHFIDNVDLVIHEAGHWVFIFFGQFIQVLGGSLLQILVPIVFAAYFFSRREAFSASIVLFWVGYNIINVSLYMADAVVMQLPLLGGNSSGHDWNYLLSQTYLLEYTRFLSKAVYSVGISVTLIAAILCLRLIFSEKTVPKEGDEAFA